MTRARDPLNGSPRAGATVLLVTLTLVGAAGCGPSTRPADPLERVLQETLDGLTAEYGFAGATAAFVRGDDRGVSVASGYSDVERKIRMQPNSTMLAGSVGKTFVAALTLHLQCDGKLNLDDKVSRWYGNDGMEIWYQGLPNAQDLTIRHLATHKSGLSDYLSDRDIIPYWVEWMTYHPTIPPTPELLVSFSMSKPPKFPAGAQFEYTDTGYLLLGLVLEKVAGKSFYESVNEDFLEPLHLSGEIIPQDRVDIPRIATGYLPEGNPYMLPTGTRTTTMDGVLSVNPKWEWTGGGFAATAMGLAKWVKILFEGKAMPCDYLDTMLADPSELGPSRSGADRGQYAMGAQIVQSSEGETYGHGGSIYGYVTNTFYHPRRGVSLALMVSQDESPHLHDAYQRLRRALFSAMDSLSIH